MALSRRVPLVVAVTLAAATGAACTGTPAAPPGEPGAATVTEVVDGDTIKVDIGGHEETIRLLGIDTPETVDPDRPVGCFGPEASTRTEELLPPGTEVRLERDQEARDQFGRLLAYVRRADDGTFVNQTLLAEGFAETLLIEPNHAYAGDLLAAQEAAQQTQAGLWGACLPGS
jgi:micrococcal nuclease